MNMHALKKRLSPVVWILAAVIVGIFVYAKSAPLQDKVTDVADDDPEMRAAIAKARASLPEFWKVFDERARGESDFCLKVKITDANGTEHFWLGHLKRQDGKLYGIISNDPQIVRCVKLGQWMPIHENDITDWLYLRDGKMVGNHTLRAMFKTMTAEERERCKQMLAEP
jgi:uncharacterized protein YegJ (DUF2314 family)